MEAATGFEPVNTGFAESLKVFNYLELLGTNNCWLLIFFIILQPIRNHFLYFAKGWGGEQVKDRPDLLFL
jgi:hypothetical protein